jgi:hypothetical protein
MGQQIATKEATMRGFDLTAWRAAMSRLEGSTARATTRPVVSRRGRSRRVAHRLRLEAA